MVIVLLITLYTSRIVLEALGIVDYGIHNVVAGFVTMFAFMSSALSSGIQRFYNFEMGRSGSDGANRVYNTALAIQCIFAIVLVIVIEAVGLWYLHNKMVIPAERISAATYIFHLAITTLVLHILQVPYTAAVMAHEQMGFYALMSIFGAVATLIGTYIIKSLEFDALILYGVLLCVIAAITLLAYIIFCKTKFEEIYLSKGICKSLFKEMLTFSGWNVLGTFGHMLKDQGVNLILNLFFGPVVNAAKGIASQINGGVQSFVTNLTIPVRPQLIQSYSQGDKDRAYNLTYQVSKLSCIMLGLIAIPIILEIDYVLQIWLGDNVPKYAAIFSIIVIINSFILNLNSAISGVVHASGIMKTYQITGGVISIITVVAAYIAISIFKEPAVAFITILLFDIIRQIASIFIVINIEKGGIKWSEYLRLVILPISVVLILSFLPSLFLHKVMAEGLSRFFVVTAISTLSILSTTYVFALKDNERGFVKQIIQRIIPLKH